MDTKSFWNDRLTTHWGTEGVGYLSLGLGFNYWMYVLRRIIFRRCVSPAHGARACDIGAGTGFYTETLIKKGYRVTSVDISSKAIQKLTHTFPDQNFIEADVADELPGSYDLIVAMDVLFHIVDDEKYRQAIQNISRALVQGGTFIFSDNFPTTRVAHRHQVSRSESEIMEILRYAGLNVTRRRPMFVLMNAPVKYRTLWWYVLERVLWRAKPFGWFIGVALFPFEYLLVTIKQHTPSTEIVICEKM